MKSCTSSDLRLALVGLGNIAHKHVEVINASSGVKLVAGVKRHPGSGRIFCEQYRIPHYFSSVRELLEWDRFDAALICVGHLFTVEIAKLILATGRPCLIEKPIGFSTAETESVLRTAEAAGTWGMVAMNRRYYSNIRRATELVGEASGLRAIHIEHTEWMHQSASWGLSAEVMNRFFYVNGIHLVDIMCHLAGLPIETHAIFRPREDGRHSFDALLRFQNDIVGHYMAQWYAPGRWSMDLFAPDLRIAFPCFEQSEILRTGEETVTMEFDEIDKRFKPGFYSQMEAFVYGVKNNTQPMPPACLLSEAVKIMDVAETLVKGGEK